MSIRISIPPSSRIWISTGSIWLHILHIAAGARRDRRMHRSMYRRGFERILPPNGLQLTRWSPSWKPMAAPSICAS